MTPEPDLRRQPNPLQAGTVRRLYDSRTISEAVPALQSAMTQFWRRPGI